MLLSENRNLNIIRKNVMIPILTKHQVIVLDKVTKVIPMTMSIHEVKKLMRPRTTTALATKPAAMKMRKVMKNLTVLRKWLNREVVVEEEARDYIKNRNIIRL